MTRLAPNEALALDLERIARELRAIAERRRPEWNMQIPESHPIGRVQDLADEVRDLAHELAPDLVPR